MLSAPWLPSRHWKGKGWVTGRERICALLVLLIESLTTSLCWDCTCCIPKFEMVVNVIHKVSHASLLPPACQKLKAKEASAKPLWVGMRRWLLCESTLMAPATTVTYRSHHIILYMRHWELQKWCPLITQSCTWLIAQFSANGSFDAFSSMSCFSARNWFNMLSVLWLRPTSSSSSSPVLSAICSLAQTAQQRLSLNRGKRKIVSILALTVYTEANSDLRYNP